MPATVAQLEPQQLADLRKRAVSQLTGPAATRSAATGAADALAVLHALASSPHTARDALALLHELQVHQVELDMQAQEVRESRAELESALRRQTELYDRQPAGCFTIDQRLVLQELNQTGAGMLGIVRDRAFGLRLDAFFGADCALRFRDAIARLGATNTSTSCTVRLRPRVGQERPVLASIGADSVPTRYLVNLTNAAEVATA